MRPLRWVFAVLLTLASIAPSAHAQERDAHEARRVKVGEMIPDIRLPTIDGQGQLSLSSLRGKKVLLIEFASW